MLAEMRAGAQAGCPLTSSAEQDAASAVSSADDKDAKQLESKYLVQGTCPHGQEVPLPLRLLLRGLLQVKLLLSTMSKQSLAPVLQGQIAGRVAAAHGLLWLMCWQLWS